MELKTEKVKGKTCHYREFGSVQEFINYIENTPLNSVFRWAHLASSNTGNVSWYQTTSYEDAQNKLRNGDDKLAKKLTGILKLEKHPENMLVQKQRYDVVGFQASVPRYLQGIPTNMVNKKQVVVPQRVVSITKNIGFLGMFSGQEIIDEAIKAVQLVNTIEARGIRCNLYVSSIAAEGGTAIGFRVKIKSANERMNISKMAFPLANPSMLRRFSFRYREVAPETTPNFKNSYGCSMQTPELFATKKGEYYIPTMVGVAEMDNILKQIIS